VETSDWVSNGLAALALLATIALTVWTNWRSSKASEHQQALVDAQHRTNSMLADLAVRLAEAQQAQDERLAIGPDNEGSDPGVQDVRWVTEHVGKNTWLLRNLGTDTATAVRVDESSIGGVRVDFSQTLPADIGPGSSLRILAIGAFGAPVGDDLKVVWGDGESEILPLPRWQ
jgi:hypothetical protein